MDLTGDLKKHAKSLGSDLVGVADLALLQGIATEPADLLAPYRYAISIAVKLPHAVFEQLTDRPTPLYAQVYLNANALLDQIALRLCAHIERQKYAALPIPASQPLDMTVFRSHLSAKAVANAAGLGWQGKSLLIVTPEYGPRVRLVTVLTDMPLTADKPLKNRCGACTCCTEACVAGAIRNVSTDFHYASREEALDFQKCADKLVKEFSQMENIGKPICGLCIKVCPWGRKLKGRRSQSEAQNPAG
ncbi:epoxyqueuosine reductase [Desulfuromonas sp. AOP6]|uniref:4Fe-4S double cluster binding domain-containing protein n=1 Tax=Desulfuromonas sp. AOP6 TaxID=1566351 RepID=UPI00127482C4|nr:epoxyqueuosine reductase [Desulfuromonas sp. AOP6]BCA79952.1 iron-sulfur-binding protein [Desulfuromonas sp. AOP6]